MTEEELAEKVKELVKDKLKVTVRDVDNRIVVELTWDGELVDRDGFWR